MATTPRARQIQDFNIDELAKTSALDELTGRVDKVETKINSADKLGEHFADAFEHSSLLRDAVSKAVLATLDNVDNRDKLEKMLAKLDRTQGWLALKRYGKYVIGAILFGAGAIFTALVNKLIH